MVRTLYATVAVLVVLAGCGAIPGDGSPNVPQHTVSIAVSNNHDESYVVRASAIPPEVEGLEVTYENGSTHRFDVTSFDALPRDELRNATAIATADSTDLTREFAVGPAEGIGGTLDDVSANVTVVYFVLQNGDNHTARGAGVVQCSSDVETTDLEIVIRPDGSLRSSVTCRSDSG
ncbi:hypothetical protein SAMN04488063_3161 [Halopelagius inordinatus]|uniref:Uncharacterized protein n=1 Tax=Halopelagius inordinatus TaxID=553467 RepID=A0A1I2VCQ5_9EURY|nr:hypothetical protein [Halopelagius inordinatus]SFG86940.1 hypothetical protein SAMN04488063_3161 [Halopelagius inordinatus]